MDEAPRRSSVCTGHILTSVDQRAGTRGTTDEEGGVAGRACEVYLERNGWTGVALVVLLWWPWVLRKGA